MRTAAVSDLSGQSASEFGRVLLTEGRDFNRGFSMAPDASFFVVSVKSGDGYDLSLRDIFTREEIQRLTTTGASNGALNMYPDVSPDGLLVAFSAQGNAEANGDLYVIRIDGTGMAKVTSSPDSSELRPSWSPDGNRLAFQSKNDASGIPNWDIYVTDVFSDGSSTGQGPQTLPPSTTAVPTAVPVTICDTTPSGESRSLANPASATGAYAGCRTSGDGTTATLNLTLIESPPNPPARSNEVQGDLVVDQPHEGSGSLELSTINHEERVLNFMVITQIDGVKNRCVYSGDVFPNRISQGLYHCTITTGGGATLTVESGNWAADRVGN